ncbi:PH domain-containing protein [Vibrio cholerae]|uniref:PH domain-containing protein n=1 Tax=Vibrio cholerae TaxID=666 RepID=UPI002FE5F83C
MATYIEKNLSNGEVVCNQVKTHWSGYVLPLIITVLGLTFPIVTLFGIYLILSLYTTQHAITNKRVVSKKGIISISTSEAQMKQIESVNIEIGVLDRILGGGCVVITMTGGKVLKLKNIDNPVKVKQNITELLEAQ